MRLCLGRLVMASGGAEAVNTSGTYATEPSGIQVQPGADELMLAG